MNDTAKGVQFGTLLAIAEAEKVCDIRALLQSLNVDIRGESVVDGWRSVLVCKGIGPGGEVYMFYVSLDTRRFVVCQDHGVSRMGNMADLIRMLKPDIPLESVLEYLNRCSTDT